MDKLTIPPLWASMILMGLRLGLVAAGVDTTATAAGHAQEIYGALLMLAGIVWAIWAKYRSHDQKKALAVAAPAEVTMPDGRSAASLRALLLAFVVVGLAVIASPVLTACAGLQSVVTRPIAGVVAEHSGGALVTAGDTVQLSLTARRTAALVQVDAAGAYKLSARAFLSADDAGAFAGQLALKRTLQADLARGLAAYRALRSLGAGATADSFAAQRQRLAEALTHVNQVLHVAVPDPPATPAG